MFEKAGRNVIIDLLFCLMMTFVILFFLSFVLMAKKAKEDDNAKNDNHILVMLRWKTDNDIDLWLKLPDGRHTGYNKRDEPPAHLDVDVIKWRKYRDSHGEEHTITINEEIITIRDMLPGEYVVNVHYYATNGVKDLATEVEIFIQDVKHRRVIFAGKKVVSAPNIETHIVRFTVVDEGKDKKGNTKFSINKVLDDRPTYFLGRGPQHDNTGRNEHRGEDE